MEKKMVCPNTEWNRKSTKGESKNRQPVMNVEDTVVMCVMMCRDDVSKYKILMDFQLVRNVKPCRNGFCTYTAAEIRLKESKSPQLSVELWKKVSYLIMGFFLIYEEEWGRIASSGAYMSPQCTHFIWIFLLTAFFWFSK